MTDDRTNRIVRSHTSTIAALDLLDACGREADEETINAAIDVLMARGRMGFIVLAYTAVDLLRGDDLPTLIAEEKRFRDEWLDKMILDEWAQP